MLPIYYRCTHLSFSNCLHISSLIAAFLIISGTELNPGPTNTRTTSASAGEAFVSMYMLKTEMLLSKFLHDHPAILYKIRKYKILVNPVDFLPGINFFFY